MAFDIHEFANLINEALKDEHSAGDVYRHMADIAPNEHFAEALRQIASDEDRHYATLERLWKEPLMAGSSFRYATNMNVPCTSAEWEDLGYDIEMKYSGMANRQMMINEVRHHVAVATNNAEGNPDESRRWLINTAGNLGIT